MFMIDLEVIREMPLDNNKLSGHWGIEREREVGGGLKEYGRVGWRGSRNRLLNVYHYRP